MKLKGWRRVWVVGGILYAIPLIVVMAFDWPTERQAERVLLSEDADIVEEWNPAEFKLNIDIQTYDCEALRGLLLTAAQRQGDQSKEDPAEELKWVLKGFQLSKVGCSKITQYQETLSDIAGARIEILGMALGAWLIPMAVLYLLGIAAGWIHRRFLAR